MKLPVTVLFASIASLACGQMVISSNSLVTASTGTSLATASGITIQSTKTDLKNVNLLLAASGTTAQGLTNSTGSPLLLNNLTIDSRATFAMIGEWGILNDLTFIDGKIFVDKLAAIPGKLVYLGSKDLVGNDNSYVNGRLFILGSGPRTFPVGTGTATGAYLPIRLESIAAADAAIPLGFEVITGDPGFTAGGIIKDIFKDHYWELTVGVTTPFSGNTNISLSANKTDQFFVGDGDATVLEKNITGTEKDLGGSVNGAFFTSGTSVSVTGKTYGLGKIDVVTVKVHKLITPDNDTVNDVLVIEGLDAFTDNEVTIMDRWGVPFKTWTGFKNYVQPAGTGQDIDFSKLAIGNYVCIVKYTDRGVAKSIKQMITVLK